MALNFEITNLNLNDIIAIIEKESSRLAEVESKQVAPQIISENFIFYKTQIDTCINILESAKTLTNSLKGVEDKNSVIDESVMSNISRALKTGLIIIDRLQTQAGKGVKYKIVLSDKTLYEANIPLEEILKDTQTVFRDKDGFSLKLIYARQQMTDAIEAIEMEITESRINSSVLSKMKKVEMNKNAKNVWDILRISQQRINRVSKKQRLMSAIQGDRNENGIIKTKKDFKSALRKMKLSEIRGLKKAELFERFNISKDYNYSSHKINEGQLIEAFYQYYLHQEQYDEFFSQTSSDIQIDTYVDLFEKSKNVLPHHYGPDAGEFQIKALSTQRNESIVTIATLTNVLYPLKDIQRELVANPGDIEYALSQAFDPNNPNNIAGASGSSDRSFGDEAKELVKNKISSVMGIKVK